MISNIFSQTVIGVATLALPLVSSQNPNFLGPFQSAYPYAVHVPSNASATAALPVIVMLHGSGSKGDLSQTLDHASWDGVGLLIREGGDNRSHVMARDDFISFIPVLPTSDDLWSADSVMESFASFLNSPPAPLTAASIDLSRVYASGYSLGGSGTWDLIRSYPANFSAALISSGGPIGLSDKDYKAIATARLPVWGFAGTEDKGTLESDVRNAIDSLNAQGGNGTFTLIEGADHYVESFAPWEYDNGAGFDFFLANSKNGSTSPGIDTTSPSLPISTLMPIPTPVSSSCSGSPTVFPANITVTL